VDYLLFSDTTRSSNSLLQAGRPTSNRLSDRVMTPRWGKNFPVRHRAWPVLGPTQPFLWSPDTLLRGTSCQETKLISHLLHVLMLPITSTHILGVVTRGWGLGQGPTNFPKIYEPPPNCGRRKGDMQYMPYSGSKVLERPVSFTVFWSLLLRAREMMYIFILQQLSRKYSAVQNIIGRKTMRLGFVHFLTGAKNMNKNASALCVCICLLKLY